MEPITGWNYIFYFGNLLADTAIALFAIKSGYIDKQYNEKRDEVASLLRNVGEKKRALNREFESSGIDLSEDARKHLPIDKLFKIVEIERDEKKTI